MNREIKFRAWSLIHNDMRLNPSLSYKDGKWSLRQKGPSTLDQDDMALEQFTGFKDKNGVDIYEGDIVLVEDGDYRIDVCDTGLGAVEFVVGLWYIDGQINNGLYDIHQENYISVVGNIHQHPELLK